MKITKGNNSAKSAGGATVVYLCMSSGHVLYVPSFMKLSRTVSSYRADTISIRKITKGNNSANNEDGVSIVNLCTSAGHALYFYQVS